MVFKGGLLFLHKGAGSPNWLEDNILLSASSGSPHKGHAGSSRHGTISKPARWARPSVGSRTVLLSPRYFRKHLDTGLSHLVHPKSSPCLCSSHPDFCTGDIARERLQLSHIVSPVVNETATSGRTPQDAVQCGLLASL